MGYMDIAARRSTVADPTPNVWPPGTAGVWADEGPAV